MVHNESTRQNIFDNRIEMTAFMILVNLSPQRRRVDFGCVDTQSSCIVLQRLYFTLVGMPHVRGSVEWQQMAASSDCAVIA